MNAHRRYFEQLARAQGKLTTPVKSPTARHSLKRITASNADTRNDRCLFDSDGIVLVLAGAVLATNNLLLRVGDLAASGYRKKWASRFADLRYLHDAEWRRWRTERTYPLILDAVYCVPHGAEMDRDGLVAALKYPIDGLRLAGFLEDDRPEYLAQVLPVTRTGTAPGLFLKLRPSPHQYGYTDQALLDLSAGADGRQAQPSQPSL